MPFSAKTPSRLNPNTWWRNLPAHRQDRVASFGPLIAVLLFVMAVITAIAYLRTQENNSSLQALQRDGEDARQHLNMRLDERQNLLQRMARQLALHGISNAKFAAVADKIANDAPELSDISWFDAKGLLTDSRDTLGLPDSNLPDVGRPLVQAEALALRQSALTLQQPVYALLPRDKNSVPLLGMMAPAYHKGRLVGVLYARYTLETLLHRSVPPEVYTRYAVSLLDSKSRTISGRTATKIPLDSSRWRFDWLQPGGQSYTVALTPENDALSLRLQTYRTNTSDTSRILLWMVLALSALTGWALLANWRHLRSRQRAQQVLLAESNFRRAMENSLVTGMRALDLQGRITHVNAAFCSMTGWSEDELIGQTPPFSFWHKDDYERNMHSLERTLGRQIPRGGHEMRVLRKDGNMFDARMYMSPLIGADGQHSGWMSSMTDITEPNRIQRQLSASHERFVRVVDAIDTAVSVAPLGAQELLFANRNYRLWFGSDDATAHVQMVAQAGSVPLENAGNNLHADSLAGDSCSSNAEILLPQTATQPPRWVEVRARYLEWTDGRLAQMVMATDISARRHAEEISARHEQRAQAASRLVTMGEMASSVAHELNQPLTAIHNYCSGMRDRIANGSMQPHDLLEILEKTARQAHRAGQIIQRIRDFVKRSAPTYSPSDVYVMVADAIELADIEMRRRNVRLSHQIDSKLPLIQADRILIEQVLVNLMKNAAEAIDNAQMPPERREVHLQVKRGQQAGVDTVEFTLCDRGAGLSQEALSHLFEAFFSTKTEGLGIGLNLCRSIVESHHGRLHAENLYNEDGSEICGCCFSFWLPVHAA